MTNPDLLCIMWGSVILALEGHSDWEIEFSAGSREGIVLRNVKTIIIHWPMGQPDVALMLHEIAHVVSGSGHDSWFAHVNMRLTRTYHYHMVSEILRVADGDDHAAIAGDTIYSLSDQIASQQIL